MEARIRLFHNSGTMRMIFEDNAVALLQETPGVTLEISDVFYSIYYLSRRHNVEVNEDKYRTCT